MSVNVHQNQSSSINGKINQSQSIFINIAHENDVNYEYTDDSEHTDDSEYTDNYDDIKIIDTKIKKLKEKIKKTENIFLCTECNKTYKTMKGLEKHQTTVICTKTYKKKYIPATLKRLVWNKYIGEYLGKSKCYCCQVTDITQLSFHCGHVIAEMNNGQLDLNNLRPICQNCNSSMGSKNMNEFIETHKLHI
jgi:hypothetical protein